VSSRNSFLQIVQQIVLGLLRARTLWPWLKTRARRVRELTARQDTAAVLTTKVIRAPPSAPTVTATFVPSQPPDLPPGTASAIAMAMQGLPQRASLPPPYVNNSQWVHWDDAYRDYDMRALPDGLDDEGLYRRAAVAAE
jgi:hypothetical protein